MGKTKDITLHNDGTCTFTFKDAACGENGVFDPGANQVGLTIAGMGKASLMLSRYFFAHPQLRVKTHYLNSDIEKGTMTCRAMKMFPVEFIWRGTAWGSFCRAYDVAPGTPLMGNAFGVIETTLKSDKLGDPRINEAVLLELRLLTPEQYTECVGILKRMSTMLHSVLLSKGYNLIDFKIECGVDTNGDVRLGDEISGGIWRITDKEGNIVDPIVAAKSICEYC